MFRKCYKSVIAILALFICPITRTLAQQKEEISRHTHIFTSRKPVHYDVRSGNASFNSVGSQPSATLFSPGKPTSSTVLGSFQVSITTTPSSCGYFTGLIFANASGGVPPYLYSFNYDPLQVSPFHFISGPTSIPVVVEDATGAIVNASAAVGNIYPSLTVGPFTQQAPNGCAATDGSITLLASGGTPPYMYSIDGVNYQTSATFSNLGAVLSVFWARDANGCTASYVYGLVPAVGSCEGITFGAEAVFSACHNDASMTFTLFHAVGSTQYSLDGVNFQTSPTFTDLSPGRYTVYCKLNDGTLFPITFYIYPDCNVTGKFLVTDATCGNNDGIITINAINGTAPFQYSLDGNHFQSGNVFSGLSPGSYEVMTKDATGYFTVARVFVNSGCPPLSISTYVINAECGSANGVISITGMGGIPPYLFSKDGVHFQNGNYFFFLAAGQYTITLEDFAGTTTTTNVTVPAGSGPTATVITRPADCNNNGGSITIQGNGGTPPYQFSIDGFNYQSGNVFNLGAGAYPVFMQDAMGCVADLGTAQVATACLQIAAGGIDASCGNSDGSITVTASNGTAPYAYSLDGINFQASNVFIGLPAGGYTVFARDAGGLSTTSNLTIANDCPTLSLTIANSTCGGDNGSLSATASGGMAPYQYSLDGIRFQTDNVFSNLASGGYTMTLKDADDLTSMATATIINTPGPTVSSVPVAAGCAGNDGSITVSGSGGTLPYAYSIDNISFQPAPLFSNLAPGPYTAIIKDVNGCVGTQPVTVTSNDNLFVNAGNDTAFCEGRSVLLRAVSNGTSFSWSPALALDNARALDPLASPAITTTYTLTANWGACQVSDNVTLTILPAPLPDAGHDTVLCSGQSVQLQGSGGQTYLWSPATDLDNSRIADPLVSHPAQSITYDLSITGANGCPSLQNASVTVQVTPPAKVFAGNDTIVLINQPFLLHAADVNNSGFDQFQWSPSTGLNNSAIADPVATPEESITYSVTASTPQGCEGKASVSIKVFTAFDLYVPNAFSPNSDGHNDLLKVIPVGIKQFHYLSIYNRNGQRIFYTTEPAVGWNGMVNGHPQNTGVYVWMTAGIDYLGELIERKGTVMLVR